MLCVEFGECSECWVCSKERCQICWVKAISKTRSEERRVGKECRSRRSTEAEEKKNERAEEEQEAVRDLCVLCCVFFFQAEDGIRDFHVTGVQTCALPIFIANKKGIR